MNKLFLTKAVLFDMDGVLLDSEPLWDEAVKDALAIYGVDYDELHRKYELSLTGVRIDQVANLYCQLVPEKNMHSETLVNKIIDLVIEKVSATKPIFAGVEEALMLCRELGLKVGLASSSPMRVIDAVTDCLNLTHYFDVRVSAEKLAYGKPNPDVYLLAAQKLGESPFNCLTIEDSIPGMIATKAAQMKSIVIPAAHERTLPQWCLADYQFKSLLELSRAHLK
ncbi:sugar-phosphatase [Orbus hercynius]|uniref:Sugar-phosphatase n=1 Tax=Orbus hercynius TaxID=593135 RepID=A0A495RHS1_9GAMM|nr:hexitol phosphatase HxpB [Orbus hercynius]RKS87042.1 sugar-phosphatase [Orbus hercynius]